MRHEGDNLQCTPLYSSASVGVISGLFFAQFYIQFNLKSNGLWKSVFNRNTLLIAIICMTFAAFYLIQINIGEGVSVSFGEFTSRFNWFWTIKFWIKNYFGSVAILAGSFVLYKSMKNRVNLRSINPVFVFVYTGLFFSSFAASIISNFNYDGYQIHTNFADATISIVIFFMLHYSIRGGKEYITQLVMGFYFFVLLFRGLPFTYPVSSSKTSKDEFVFYANIKREINLINNPIFGYYRNYDYLKRMNVKYVQTSLFLPLEKLVHLLSDGSYNPYCMSVLDIPDVNNSQFDERKTISFGLHIENEKALHPASNYNDWTKSFITKYNINFIVVEGKVSLPDFICNNSKLVAEYGGIQVLKMTTFE